MLICMAADRIVGIMTVVCRSRRELLGEHGGGLLVGEVNLMDGVAAVLEGDIVVVDVRGEEDLWELLVYLRCRRRGEDGRHRTWVPSEALAGGEVGDLARALSMFLTGLGRYTYEPGRSIRVTDVDDGALLLGDGRT